MGEFKPGVMPKIKEVNHPFKVGDFTNHGTITFIDATHDFLHGNVKNRWENVDGTNNDLSVKTDKGWFRLSDLVPAKQEFLSVDKNALKPEIDFKEFQRVDVRVCEVISAEKVKGADKLLVLKINTGKDERQVVTNLGEFFSSDFFVGKRFPFVLNLKPVKIRKIDSFGMIMAIEIEGGKPELIETKAPVGSKLI